MNTSTFLRILPASLVLATGAVSAQNLIPLYSATAGAVSDVASASLLEVWIDETERRTWFLFESTRARTPER